MHARIFSISFLWTRREERQGRMRMDILFFLFIFRFSYIDIFLFSIIPRMSSPIQDPGCHSSSTGMHESSWHHLVIPTWRAVGVDDGIHYFLKSERKNKICQKKTLSIFHTHLVANVWKRMIEPKNGIITSYAFGPPTHLSIWMLVFSSFLRFLSHF